MRILFLHKWLVMGGIEKVLLNYLHLLKNEKDIHIDLLIAFDTPQSSLKNDIPKQIRTNYIFDIPHYIKQEESYKHRKRSFATKLQYKVNRFREKQYCKKTLNNIVLNYDIVINFSNHFDPFIDFKRLHIPIIRWQHSALKDIYKKETKKEISYLKRYDKVIAICEDMKNDIQEKSKITSNRIEYIYNPLSFSRIEFHAKEKIDIKYPYLVQVARLDKSKKHSELIDIYLELRKKGINQKLYIIGNGPEYESLSTKIKNLSLENDCILLGEIENPYPYIKNADLFLHTSEREGLPTVLLESAILETAIVTMDCPTGPREITNNGECGELISLGNKEDFVEKTYRLINNIELRQQYINRMNHHLSFFSEEKVKKDFLTLIRNIANGNIKDERNI